jgi:Uma2 family endonuclease
MGYTTPNHDLIVANLIRFIGSCLAEKGCYVYGSNRLVYAEECNHFYYPDITIVCDEPQYQTYKRNMQATINPSIVIEILSETTEKIDFIEKKKCYKKIPSLTQYIIISQAEYFISIYRRLTDNEEGDWLNIDYMSEDDVLKIGDCLLGMKDVYEKVVFVKPKKKK